MLIIDPEKLHELEERLGTTFDNLELLQQALVHKSYVNERPNIPLASNERMEFLGDAIIGAVVAHRLFERFPDLPEGDLTVIRAGLVRESTLASWAREMDMGAYLLLGRGEELGGGRERPALLARAFEAVVAAIYLQRGFEAAARFILRFVDPEIERVPRGRVALDAKSLLQQRAQAVFETTPTYRVLEVKGPGHNPLFTVEVRAGAMLVARGTGRSKQAAQQAAAQAALEKLDQILTGRTEASD